MKPPDSVVHPHTSALGQTYSLVSPSTITSSYQPKRNHQMSTPWYKHSGTPTSSFFFTTQCTLSGTTHTVRPYMYPSMVHPIRTNHFQTLYHLYRHIVSDSSYGLWWEHLLGQHTHTVSADVPHV